MSISLKQIDIVIGQHIWHTCGNPIVTTNQKPAIDTQKL